jgi:hypothetical protein
MRAGDNNVVRASQDGGTINRLGWSFLEGASVMHPQVSSTATHSSWRRWFAWHPVFLQVRIGTRPLVWLQYVERRWTEGETSGLGPRWIYRTTRIDDGHAVLDTH